VFPVQYLENREVVGPRQLVIMEHGLPSRTRPLLKEGEGGIGRARVARTGVGGWCVVLPSAKGLEEYASLDVGGVWGGGGGGGGGQEGWTKDVEWWHEARETVLKAR